MILLLLFALAQDSIDERVDRLCRDLESTDVAKVTRAVSSLSAIGADAVAPLEAHLKDARGRHREYLEFAVDEIRVGRGGQRLKLKSSDRTVVEVLNELHRKTGALFSIENLIDDVKLPEIAVDVSDATMLEALDAICRAANVSVSIEGNQFAFYPDNYVEKPRCFFGGFQHLLQGYGHQKVVDFRKPAVESFNLSLQLLWSPAHGAPFIREHHVIEALDDRGKSLLLPPDPEAPRHDGGAEPLQQILLVPPTPGAEKLRILRGYSLIAVPKDLAEIPLPELEPGKSTRVGDFRVKLLKIDAPNSRFEFEIASATIRPRDLKNLPIGAAVTVKGGDPARCYQTQKEVSEQGVTVGVQYQAMRTREFPAAPGDPDSAGLPLEKIVVTVATRQQDRRIPFEFRDVKIR